MAVHPDSDSRSRSYFWPAFVVTFGLLALGSCAGVVVLAGLDNFRLADFQQAGVSWQPPVAVADLAASVEPGSSESDQPASSETPEPAQAEGAVSLRFAVGDRAVNVTSSRVNLRRSVGYLGKPADDVIAQMQPGELVTILDGPRTADSLTWWWVRYTGAGASDPVDGWVAESTASGVQILGKAD